MVNGVIFDMDGLMFDTERIWATLWDPALASLGMTYKEGLDDAARGSAGESMDRILRQFYGEECDTAAIKAALNREADRAFAPPPPKKPGLDELMGWLTEQGIPMAVASSSRRSAILHHLENWEMTHAFKAVVSGDEVTDSKPNPEIFLLAAKALGTAPAHTLVLEDSHNGIRAGAAGGFITVMVPDLMPADEEMQQLFTAQCKDLHEVLAKLKAEEFCNK